MQKHRFKIHRGWSINLQDLFDKTNEYDQLFTFDDEESMLLYYEMMKGDNMTIKKCRLWNSFSFHKNRCNNLVTPIYEMWSCSVIKQNLWVKRSNGQMLKNDWKEK